MFNNINYKILNDNISFLNNIYKRVKCVVFQINISSENKFINLEMLFFI